LSIHIRRAETDDLETLCSIEKECFTTDAFTKEQLEYLLENLKGISLIAQINNETVGFILGLINNYDKTRTGHVYTIDVAVKHRRRGVGRRLLREFEERLVENGVRICYLEARRGNVVALELYRKQGYTEVDVLRNFYSEGVDGVRLVKKLSARRNRSFNNKETQRDEQNLP
jgi:ribosomal-protein-alanine N-acetyltransferase